MEEQPQIKIALVGRVSAGKTTVLNALLAAPYGEVAMRRTTAGINHFRLRPNSTSSPEEIRRRIEQKNVELRQHSIVEELHFDVTMRESLVGTMRRNTQLVIVDTPGFCETGAGFLHEFYLRDIWNTFDCVIVVMDVSHAANTMEQIRVLRFVKENVDKSPVPVIILCNKVDEPKNPEIKRMVKEMKDEVEKIFRPSKPDFIPISAQNAYFYRAASQLPKEQYKSLGTDHIQRICREERGRNAEEMNEEQQVDFVFSVVNDPRIYEARLQNSNFSSLIDALKRLFGTRRLQAEVFRQRMKGMHNLYKNFLQQSARFFLFRTNVNLHGMSPSELRATILRIWWDLWEEEKNDAIESFKNVPARKCDLHRLFDMLQDAQEIPVMLKEDPDKICAAMKRLVREKCSVIVNHASEASSDLPAAWRFSPLDWNSLIASTYLVLMSYSEVCAMNFIAEVADLQHAQRNIPNGPQPDRRELSVRVLVPETPNEPNHWGHLELNVCRYLKINMR